MVHILGLSYGLKVVLFTLGSICVMLASLALHIDREFDSEMRDARGFIVVSFMTAFQDGKPRDVQGESNLAHVILEDILSKHGNISDLSFGDQLEAIAQTTDNYMRPIELQILALVIVVCFTGITGLSLSRVTEYFSDFTKHFLSEIYFGVSCLAFLLACILEMSSALKYAKAEETSPFGCKSGSELPSADLEDFHVCQVYGAKIIAGVSALACAIISSILVVLYVIFKTDPTTTRSEARTPHRSNFDYRLKPKIVGKLIDINDMINENDLERLGENERIRIQAQAEAEAANASLALASIKISR